MFRLEFGSAAQPELLDKLVPLRVCVERFEPQMLFGGDDVDRVLLELSAIGARQVVADLLGDWLCRPGGLHHVGQRALYEAFHAVQQLGRREGLLQKVRRPERAPTSSTDLLFAEARYEEHAQTRIQIA